jgi:hypothetical protein
MDMAIGEFPTRFRYWKPCRGAIRKRHVATYSVKQIVRFLVVFQEYLLWSIHLWFFSCSRRRLCCNRTRCPLADKLCTLKLWTGKSIRRIKYKSHTLHTHKKTIYLGMEDTTNICWQGRLRSYPLWTLQQVKNEIYKQMLVIRQEM